MKKLLTILLALLVVTGVVFADDPKLTLVSSVEGGAWHGFSKSAQTGVDIKDNTGDYGDGDIEEEGVVVQITGQNLTGQAVGFYGLFITQTANVNVFFRSKWVLEGSGNSVGWEIPFALNFGLDSYEESNDRLDGTYSSNGIAGASGIGYDGTNSSNIAATEASVKVIDKTDNYGNGTGPGWISLELTADFVDNADKVPEGTYVGTVYAEINTN